MPRNLSQVINTLKCKERWRKYATKLDAGQVMTFFFFFFFFLETTAEYGLILTSKYKYISTRLRAMISYECLCGAFSNESLCGEKFWRID